MKRIVIGGQIDKERLAQTVREICGDKVIVTVKTDIEAAMDVKTNVADYYLGACNTGGGGALAMAIALLGANQCVTVSMPGNIKNDDEIRAEFAAGKKAFGFTAQHIDIVVPVILAEILK
ncbi:MAG: DUF2620 domain-containing protein [Fusobacteriaceae bacterium]